MVVRDNAAGIDASACSGCTIDHNQSVTYTGGTGPLRLSHRVAQGHRV
jgi:hypothetical protein